MCSIIAISTPDFNQSYHYVELIKMINAAFDSECRQFNKTRSHFAHTM